MLAYYIDIAAKNLKKSRVLTALIIAALGLGVGCSMTMISVVHSMSGDPLPLRSAQLFYPQLDPSPPGFAQASDSNPAENFTWFDAKNLLDAHRAEKQAMMAGGRVSVRAEDGRSKASEVRGRYVTSEFFEMFGSPFASGQGWSAEQDGNRARIVVLNKRLAQKVFGDAEYVGRNLLINETTYRVVGILDDWHPQPLFYGGTGGDSAFKNADDFFLPLNTAMEQKLPVTGGMACWGRGAADRLGSDCAWLQFWVQLSTPERVAAYQEFLANYWREQRMSGRAMMTEDPKLYTLMQRLDQLRLVPPEVALQLWLSLAFLAVCIFNTSSLMFAKFLGRRDEVCIRRAMGASRTNILSQFGIESALLGVAGASIGFAVALMGLWLVKQRPDGYAAVVGMDTVMLLSTITLSVIAAMISALVPAWRICRVEPALQLNLM